MFSRTGRRRMMLTMVTVVAVIAVAIPTCQMVGCNMNVCADMMALATHTGPSFGNACDGSWIAGSGQFGVPPSEFTALLLAFLATIAAAVALFSPRVEVRPVRVIDANAPPPPLDPRGERFTV